MCQIMELRISGSAERKVEGRQPYLVICFAIEEKELFDTSRLIFLINGDQDALEAAVAPDIVAQNRTMMWRCIELEAGQDTSSDATISIYFTRNQSHILTFL